MKELFIALLEKLDCPKIFQDKLWMELNDEYSAPRRQYHNLDHLKAMFNEMSKFEDQIEDIDILAFSIWYHDIIYNASKSNNEVLSAEKAQRVLSFLKVDEDRITRCFDQIMATQTHKLMGNENKDLMFLLDFDLEVLGRDWSAYKIYSQQIRKEYSIYPGFLYRKGRKKALITFLERDKIYHTEFYLNTLEKKARENIQREVGELS